MKNKPNKYGMRVECVCESNGGYVCQMEVYTATGDNTVNSLVTGILNPFENKNYRVYMDRCYSSPILFRELPTKGIYAVGTCMSNRRNLPGDDAQNLQKGERVARQWGDIRTRET